MESFAENMREYQKQLEQGAIQAAYRGLLHYMLGLKTHFRKRFPAYAHPGGLYSGSMDMTYFSILPESLKQRDLKIAVVFLHEAFRFEVWLAGYNKQVQAHYWAILQKSDWRKYRLVPTPRGVDSILEHTLADPPDFGDLDALTGRIERGTAEFIADVEAFLEAVPEG